MKYIQYYAIIVKRRYALRLVQLGLPSNVRMGSFGLIKINVSVADIVSLLVRTKPVPIILRKGNILAFYKDSLSLVDLVRNSIVSKQESLLSVTTVWKRLIVDLQKI
jgi:hypothetical protein